MTQPAFLDRHFDILDEFGVDIESKQRRKPAIDFPGVVPLTGASQFPKILVLGRKGDAAARDPAIDAED